ncbi:MAG: reverse transcriptase family protein [Myxococcota bacterium]
MSAPSERTVDATPLVVLPPVVSVDGQPEVKPNGKAEGHVPEVDRRALATQRAADAARWRAIVEAGGAEAWIAAEMRAQGLTVDDDPSSLTDATKAAYKERKKAEAAGRRALRRAAWAAYRATHVVHVGAGVFFRDEIPISREAEAARQVRASRNDLAALDSVDALATGLGLTAPELRALCYHREVESSSHYRRWEIPKRDGTARVISAPKERLKEAQRWLVRNVFEKLPVHQAAHGFLPERSIVSNAALHAGADVVVKVDLLDFFPSVTFARVKGLLRSAGLPEPVAILTALLCTEPPREMVKFRNRTLWVATGPRALPQGAPTSPSITNALCRKLDRRLSGLGRTFGFTYTRYADDLTFSWRRPADDPRASAPIGMLLRGIRQVVEGEGFRIHQKKTAVMRPGGTQRVTGLVVNEAEGAPPVRIPRDLLRRLRAALHNRERGREGQETLEQLAGMAAFVYMVDPAKGRALQERIAALS